MLCITSIDTPDVVTALCRLRSFHKLVVSNYIHVVGLCVIVFVVFVRFALNLYFLGDKFVNSIPIFTILLLLWAEQKEFV